MVRYYFHVRDGSVLLLDEEGEDMPDLDTARDHAIECAREILSEAALSGTAASLDLQIEVADQLGPTGVVVPVGHSEGTDSQG
jgi:hypothetical protein